MPLPEPIRVIEVDGITSRRHNGVTLGMVELRRDDRAKQWRWDPNIDVCDHCWLERAYPTRPHNCTH